MLKILFVCMGNICRSPMAQGVARVVASHKAPRLQLELDSAGTHAYHIGEPPDIRAQRTAAAHGVDLSALRARVLCADDFMRFDQILVMDQDNLRAVHATRPSRSHAEAGLLLDCLPQQPLREVPDPYYGTAADFERVYQLCHQAADALLARWANPGRDLSAAPMVAPV